MPRALTPRQTHQNAAFLTALARTGNARDAARSCGIHRATLTRRRTKHPAFAAAWDAALADAHAELVAIEPARPSPERRIIRTRDQCQIRQVVPGRMTRLDEQRFLSALAGCANVRLAAKATGFTHAAFYHRRRNDPGFAREWRLALQQGYATLEAALLESFSVDAHANDAWRHSEPPALPPMVPAQAMQLLYLHQKEARLTGEPQHLKRRRGEPYDSYWARCVEMRNEWFRREREKYDIAQADRRAEAAALRSPTPRPPTEPLPLPDLAQVTGWSRADPAKVPHGPAALFGGWRVEHLRKRE